jgi:type I restriction enzyme S subunit
LPLLSVARERGVFARSLTDEDENHNAIPEDLSNYKVVRMGNLVINKMKAWQGSMGIAPCDGIVSPAYFVFEFKIANPSFGQTLLRSKPYVACFARASDGVRIGQWDLSASAMRQIPVLLPPADEQDAIVRFLNWATGRLDRTIRIKRKLIALLNEQKQAIIHRVVTRDLDPDVPLKPSGVPWLGDIPRHWQVLRSKYIFHEIDSRSATGTETHLCMSQKLGLVPRSEIEEKRLVSESYVGAKLCESEDLVLNRLKAHLGVFALAHQPGLVSPDYTVLRRISAAEPRYFEAVYRTPACRVELRQRAKGIVEGFWRLYTDDFYDIRVPVPPLQEQRSIMTKLDHALLDLNGGITQLGREIELVREYRTRLISDVVTGKLDVRGVQIPVDEMAESAQPLEPTELDSEEEEIIEEYADAD